jgi:hypothetical protein
MASADTPYAFATGEAAEWAGTAKDNVPRKPASAAKLTPRFRRQIT